MMYSLLNNVGNFRGPRGFGGTCGMNGLFFGGVHMLLWLVVIGFVVYFIYHNQKKNHLKNQMPQSVPSSESNYDEALKRLAMRFADGEIDEETYIKMKEQLKD